MVSYIQPPVLYVGVIIYPCPNPRAGFAIQAVLMTQDSTWIRTVLLFIRYIQACQYKMNTITWYKIDMHVKRLLLRSFLTACVERGPWKSLSWITSTMAGLYHKPDSRFAPSQWETALLCNVILHWLGASLELALHYLTLFNVVFEKLDLNCDETKSHITMTS